MAYSPIFGAYKTENIQYVTPIETIRRKFALKREKAGLKKINKDVAQVNKFFGGAQRQGYAAGMGEYHLNYMFFKKNNRTTGPSTDELALRERFAVVSRGVQHIQHDLGQITRVQNMWKTAVANPTTKSINGVVAYGYNYPGWIFAVQYAGKKESSSYDVDTFPQAFDN